MHCNVNNSVFPKLLFIYLTYMAQPPTDWAEAWYSAIGSDGKDEGNKGH